MLEVYAIDTSTLKTRQGLYEQSLKQIMMTRNLGAIHGWGTIFGTHDLRNMSHWTWCLS